MRMTPLALLYLCSTGAWAQAGDEGTFSIRRGGREIGREEFAIVAGRHGGAPGTTITSRVRIPAVVPEFTQEASVERRADGSFVAAGVFHTSPNSGGRVLAEIARGVLRVHSAYGGSESIREYPAQETLIVLADSAFTLLVAAVDFATPEGRRLVGLYPVSGRRVSLTAQRSPGNAPGETRILLAGDIAGTIWLDGSGNMARLEFPAFNIELIRLRR